MSTKDDEGWRKLFKLETEQDENAWQAAQLMADNPAVHDALQGFSEDPTGDNGVIVVQTIMEVLKKKVTGKELYALHQLGDPPWEELSAADHLYWNGLADNVNSP